jgi:hypothetical protein
LLNGAVDPLTRKWRVGCMRAGSEKYASYVAGRWSDIGCEPDMAIPNQRLMRHKRI